jgi:mannose-6-phosphate isomerase-like protein (cupin superfamily)
LIADGDGDRVVIVPMQDDGVTGVHTHVKDIYVVIMKGNMVMWFVVHANDPREIDTGRLGNSGKRQQPDRQKPRKF